MGSDDAAGSAAGIILAALKVDDPTPEQIVFAMLAAHVMQDVMEIRRVLVK